MTSLAERLRKRTNVGPGGCWIWTGARTPHGYGQVQVDGRRMLIHRASWEQENGPIPAGLLVLHRCDTPPCINPEHLFLGTQSDNMRDSKAKGRSGWITHPERVPRGDNHGSRRRRDERPRGEAHGQARLTEDAVRDILGSPWMSNAAMAQQYGVSEKTVYCVRRGLTWQHVARRLDEEGL